MKFPGGMTKLQAMGHMQNVKPVGSYVKAVVAVADVDDAEKEQWQKDAENLQKGHLA